MPQHRAERRQLRWLHTASLLMLQGRRQAVSLQSGRGSSQRRWKQRQNLAQKLLESPAEVDAAAAARCKVLAGPALGGSRIRGRLVA